MSTTFRPRAKRAARYLGLRPQGTVEQLKLNAGRSRVYIDGQSFVVPYRCDQLAAVVAQNDPASVIGLPTPSGKTEFVRVGLVSRVAPA